MATTTQISAHISKETKDAIEAYVRQKGVKKAFLIEEALRHHLQALREIPEDLMIPGRMVLTPESMERVAEQIERDEEPTEALKSLFRD